MPCVDADRSASSFLRALRFIEKAAANLLRPLLMCDVEAGAMLGGVPEELAAEVSEGGVRRQEARSRAGDTRPLLKIPIVAPNTRATAPGTLQPPPFGERKKKTGEGLRAASTVHTRSH